LSLRLVRALGSAIAIRDKMAKRIGPVENRSKLIRVRLMERFRGLGHAILY